MPIQPTAKRTLQTSDDGFLRKALERAEQEGRLDGAFACPVCGMRYAVQAGAIACCADVPQTNRKGA